MTPESRPLLSRRQFLQNIGIGSGVSLLSIFVPRPEPVRVEHNENGITIRDGVMIHDEHIPIDYKGLRVKVKVNEQAFLDTLDTLVDYHKYPREPLEQFLKTYGLRIALHQDNNRDTRGEYLPSRAVDSPMVFFPDSHLVSTLDAYLSRDNRKIRQQDAVVIHELDHFWQDAYNSLTIPATEAMEPGMTVLGIKSGWDIMVNRFVVLGERAVPKEALLFGASGAVLGYYAAKYPLSIVTPVEVQVRLDVWRIIGRPEIARNLGNYFWFSRA